MSNEQEKKAKRRKDLLGGLSKLSQEMEKSRLKYEAENNAWWDGLTEEEREDAFYAVCKRIHKAELEQRGSYRYALYDVFGFDMGMYGRGMDCGYMAIHNAIFDGEELISMKGVTRFEVIDNKGRSYVKYLDKDERIKYSLQDEDRTLKVFIDTHSWKEEL
jgi:hypothetical protein